MTDIYPASYYRDPANGAADEMRFMESRVRRRESGCRGCKFSPDGGLSCDLKQMPGKFGYCEERGE